MAQRRVAKSAEAVDPGPEVQIIKIEELKQDPKNTRQHGPRDLSALGESLRRFGSARSIVIDKDNRIRAGNATFQKAMETGVQRVAVVETDGDVLVAVKRRDWDDGEAELYAITDNRVGDLSENNWPEIAEQLKAALDRGEEEHSLQTLGWEQWELEPILAADWNPGEATGDLEDYRSHLGKPIRVTPEQREIFERASQRLIEKLQELGENTAMSEGQAVELICADFLGGV